MIRVLLVAVPALFRGALASALGREPDLVVLPEDVDAEPDITVIDLDILVDRPPPQDSPADLPSVPVLALATELTPKMLRYMNLVAVSGLVAKDNGVGHLARAVRRVVDGERVMDYVRIRHPVVRSNPLTGREIDVLRLIARGLGAADIAGELRLTTGTVRTYLSGIVRKTGSRNRLEAVRVADRAGWL